MKRFLLVAGVIAVLLGGPNDAWAVSCDRDASVVALEKAVKADSGNGATRYALAAAYANHGCFDAALEAFGAAIHSAQGDLDLIFQCRRAEGGILLQARNDAAGARIQFLEALRLRANDPDSLEGIALADEALGRGDEAVGLMDRALKNGPENLRIRYRRALVLNDALEHAGEGATQALRQRVVEAFKSTAARAELAPGDEESRKILVVCDTRLGEIYRDTKRPEWALKVLKRAVKADPGDFASRFILGQVYYQVHDFASMVEQYRKAVELDPHQALARFNLGVAYVNQERFYEAWGQFKEVCELEPGNAEARALQIQTAGRAVEQEIEAGATRFAEGDFAAARSNFSRALDVDPSAKIAKEYLAKVDARSGREYKDLMGQAKDALAHKRREDAMETLDKVLALRPGDKDAQELRERAQADIDKMVERYIVAGDADLRRGDRDSAEVEYKRAGAFASGREQAQRRLAGLRKSAQGRVTGSLSQAKIALKRGDLAAARNAFRESLALAPGNAAAVNGLSEVNGRIGEKVRLLDEKAEKSALDGEKGDAEREFNAALALDPDDAAANAGVARLTGNASTAKVNADKVRSLYYQGVDLYVNNHIREAIAVWKELLAIDPAHADARRDIERAQAKLKALEKL